MSFTLQSFKSDTIADFNSLGTGTGTFTITSGNFTTDSDTYLTISPKVTNKREIIRCSISGTNITVTERGVDGTVAVSHDAGETIIFAFVPSLYTAFISGTNSAIASGWQDAAETWTYSSATAITVPSGAASKYGKGDKIKFQQSIPLQNYWAGESNADTKGSITMTNIGTPTYTAGKFANAITLNGTDQALKIGDDTLAGTPTMKLGNDSDNPKAFTIGAWVNATASAGDKCIFQSYSDNTNSNGIVLYITATTGLIKLAVGNNAASASSTLTGTADLTGGYHYIVLSSQGNFTKIFVDGVLAVSGYTVTPKYAANNYVRIGCSNDTGSNAGWFKGQIDDLFIINGFAVDDQWVAAKYTANTAQGTSNITATQYMYVTGVADTALTVNGGVDYVPYNGTITGPYYSKVANPLNFPDWFAYIPTQTGITSPVGWTSFRASGRTCTYNIPNLGGTSNDAAYTITLPMPTSAKSAGTSAPTTTKDNSSWLTAPGSLGISAGVQTVATLGKTLTVGGGYTASGDKYVQVCIEYEF